MMIPECLVWAMGDDGCTAVKIYCAEDLREEIASRFTEAFNEEYEKVMDLIEEEDGDDVYYLEENNGFVIVSIDGYIRTFFYPEDVRDRVR